MPRDGETAQSLGRNSPSGHTRAAVASLSSAADKQGREDSKGIRPRSGCNVIARNTEFQSRTAANDQREQGTDSSQND